MSDEERSHDEAQDQGPQNHGVTELEEPDAQQAAHLNQVQGGDLQGQPPLGQEICNCDAHWSPIWKHLKAMIKKINHYKAHNWIV